MKIDIQLLGINSDMELREHLQKKLYQFESIYNSIVDGKMCLREDINTKKKDKIADILLMMPQNVIYAEGRSENYKGACDNAIEGAKRQLRKYKTKLSRQIAPGNI